MITFRSVPADNYGAGYAVSLPASMQPRTIFEAVTETHTAEPGALHIQRPRLLSPAMLYGDSVGHRKITVRLMIDIMQALDMSCKPYTLFYKVAYKLDNSKETLEKLHELRIGLQSNDARFDLTKGASVYLTDRCTQHTSQSKLYQCVCDLTIPKNKPVLQQTHTVYCWHTSN